MTDRQIAAEIRKVYPGHCPAAYSFAKHPDANGVMLVPGAQRIKDALEPPAKPKPKRRKSVCFHARLSPTSARAVEEKMKRVGISSKQTLMETLLTRWVKEEDNVR